MATGGVLTDTESFSVTASASDLAADPLVAAGAEEALLLAVKEECPFDPFVAAGAEEAKPLPLAVKEEYPLIDAPLL